MLRLYSISIVLFSVCKVSIPSSPDDVHGFDSPRCIDQHPTNETRLLISGTGGCVCLLND
jgi:hypothetical protein